MKIGIYLDQVRQRLVSCRPLDSIEIVARLLNRHQIGAMPVLEAGGRMVGIISERDLVRGFSEHAISVLSLRAQDLMTRDVITCGPHDTLSFARGLMREHGFRHMPIVEAGTVRGMISVRDLLEDRLKEQQLEINVLRDTVVAARHR